MKSRLRNITVTLEENVARWARLEAARKETSVSRLVSEVLKERMLEKDGRGCHAPGPGTKALPEDRWPVPVVRGGP